LNYELSGCQWRVTLQKPYFRSLRIYRLLNFLAIMIYEIELEFQSLYRKE
jgi:hypothetical protein